MYLSPIEVLLYHLFLAKGFDVEYYIYDEKIPINEVITKDRIEKYGKERFWSTSVRNAERLLKASKVDYQFITISSKVQDILDGIPKKLESILRFQFDGIEFGDIVKGVMFRYYKSISFGEDALEIARSFLICALTNYFQIKEICSSKNYEFILFSHGIYCTWEPVAQFCRKNRLKYVCYDRAKTRGHCNYNLNYPSPNWSISAAWDRLENYELTYDEVKKVDLYLQERILQKGDVFSYNFSGKVSSLDTLKSRLGIQEKSKVVTIFTNLIWDAANVSRDIAFESPLRCIIATIMKYGMRENVHILIRIHPAEKVLGTKERYGQLVREELSSVPNNVTIVEPEDDINSFSILDISDIGVVHTSTVGLEMAIENKPVILISDTHYRDKGFTYDAISAPHYFQILNKLIACQEPLPNQVKLAKKYFYLMMFEYQHKMPMTFTRKGAFDGYGYKSFNNLLEDQDAPINKIVDRIVEGDFDDFIFR